MMKKKIISLILSLVMVFTMLPTYTVAFADDLDDANVDAVEVVECNHRFIE